MRKVLLLLALCACFYYSVSHADQAVCTPPPPANSVIIGTTSCGITNGNPSMTITVLVPVTQDDKVYRLVQNLTPTGKGDLVMVEAGNVPRGTACDATQSIMTKGITYYRVDRTLVTFTGNNKPPTVWSICT